MELLDYINKYHSSIIDEYKRFSTPFYYEPGVAYKVLVSGYGSSGPNNRKYFIVDGDYLPNGEIFITLRDENDKEYGCNKSDIHLKFKRFDESAPVIGKEIPNSRTFIYINHNNELWKIVQFVFRDYHSNRLGGRWIVSKYNPEEKKKPYFELYSMIGNSEFSCKCVKSYDNIGWENYDFHKKITVREFKKLVFGDPNIKFKCVLFK